MVEKNSGARLQLTGLKCGSKAALRRTEPQLSAIGSLGQSLE